jgi:N-methylhydantoinase A
MRYEGQEHTVKIEIPDGELTSDHIPRIAASFGDAHEMQYGHQTTDPVQIVTLRVRAVGVLPKPKIAKRKQGTGDVGPAFKGSRAVYQSTLDSFVQYRVYDRFKLLAGDQVAGPAIIEEPSHTTIVHEGDLVTVGDYGELAIAIFSTKGGIA